MNSGIIMDSFPLWLCLSNHSVRLFIDSFFFLKFITFWIINFCLYFSIYCIIFLLIFFACRFLSNFHTVSIVFFSYNWTNRLRTNTQWQFVLKWRKCVKSTYKQFVYQTLLFFKVHNNNIKINIDSNIQAILITYR